MTKAETKKLLKLLQRAHELLSEPNPSTCARAASLVSEALVLVDVPGDGDAGGIESDVAFD